MPVAVPWTCWKILSPKEKTFSLRTKSKSTFMCGLGRGRELLSSIAERQASVPSSCGMFKYKFDTSMVRRRASLGIGVVFKIWMSSCVLLRRDGMVERVGFRKWSMKEEIFSVGPLILLTIGLRPYGFLWIFFRK